jgi:hypothetical protein
MLYLAIQSIAVLAIVAAWFQGWLQIFVIYDPTFIGQAIAGLGVVGSWYIWRAWQSPRTSAQHLATASTLASWCVQLGLIGTLVGFVIALHGVTTASSAAEVKAMTGSLVAGMGIAINTSIVGAVVALFLDIHRRAFKLATGVRSDEE